MLYITYNDAPSGVYFSQVTDVCEFISSRMGVKVKLLALISVRNFFLNRNKIKIKYPNSIVLPMFPKARNWRMNKILVRLTNIFLKENNVMARGPFAANICIDLRNKGVFKKICFDARGAYTAELNEYNVVKDKNVKKEIKEIERRAVLESDQRLAVSKYLIEYWKNSFAYSSTNHVVIPCTLNSRHAENVSFEIKRASTRKEFGIAEDEILICYSGSVAGWQSFELLDDLIAVMLERNKKIKLLFLSPSFQDEIKKILKFKDRIIRIWLDPEKVFEKMCACDYGILLREGSITNRVSSPVKFAEYLAAGMKVIISDNIGDYADFVVEHDCGMVVRSDNFDIDIKKPTVEEKNRMIKISHNYFSKENFIEQYKKIVS